MATCTKEYNKLEEIQCQAAELSNKMKHLKEKVCEHREHKRKQFEEEIQGYEQDIKEKKSKLHDVNMQLEEHEQKKQGAKNAQYVTKEDVDKYNSIPMEDRVNVNPRGRAPSTSHTYDYTKQAWVNYRKAGIMKDGRERLQKKPKPVSHVKATFVPYEGTLSASDVEKLKAAFVGDEEGWQILPAFNEMHPGWGKDQFFTLIISLSNNSELIHTTVFDNKETLIWVLLGAPEQGNVSMRIFTSTRSVTDIEEITDVLLKKKQYAKCTGSEESDDDNN